MLNAFSRVPNASEPSPGLYTSGQPQAAELEALQLEGLTAVIDLRDPMEPRPFDEPATVRRLGMTYTNVPVRQGALDDATMDAALAALRTAAGRPALLHCASANRTGGPLLAWLMLDRGMPEEEAVMAAMKAGLRGVDVMEWAVDYARRKTGG